MEIIWCILCLFDLIKHKKSKLSPILLDLTLEDGQSRKIIFKGNDNIIIDSLVLQLFELIDRILLERHIDLRFTNYRVIPMTNQRGLIEFVPSTPLSAIKEQYQTIDKYFESVVAKNVYSKEHLLDNYTRSVGNYL